MSGLDVMAYAWSYYNLLCGVWLMPLGGLLFSEGKRTRTREEARGEGREGKGNFSSDVINKKKLFKKIQHIIVIK